MKNSNLSKDFSKKWRFILIMSALVAVNLLPGCVDFNSQTMTYQYDKKTDTLRIFQNYRGIIATGSEKGLEEGEVVSEKDRKQLDSVVNGQRTFFFSNWILEYDQAVYKELRASLKTPEGREQEDLSAEGLVKMEQAVDVALKNIRIENGPFYLDSEKQLSAVQYVTVSNFSALMTAINDFAPHFMKADLDDESSEKERSLVENFFKSSQPLVEFEGNALMIHLPISREEYEKEFGDQSNDPEKPGEMRRAGFGISFANDIVSFRLGEPDEPINRLSLNVSKYSYNNRLADYVGSQHAVADKLDVSSLSREFMQNGKRLLLNRKK